ncbi:MAG: GGDEF domain-containing protein [Gammaproteobacteria bacterium]|nr:GGDEF domain-containing protein [Gammaproteobacteria bacterium]
MKGDLKQNTLFKLEIPVLLREISAVVAFIVDDQGNIKDANRGFKLLLNYDKSHMENWNVREYFIQPSFSYLTTIYSEDSTPIYQGILNIGVPNSYCRSIIGSIYRHENILLVVGEFDIAELERLSSSVIEINEEMGQLQRDLVKANQELRRNEKKITEMMLTDPLTEIPNRRHFDQKIGEEIERHQRYGHSLSIAMADIDLFKSINDVYGHDVIKRFAHSMKESKRSSDFVARVGGEEFMILLPQTSIEQAYFVIDRMRKIFSAETYSNIDRKITASFGITLLQESDNLDSIIKRADQGLYQAKESGRNKVITQL